VVARASVRAKRAKYFIVKVFVSVLICEESDEDNVIELRFSILGVFYWGKDEIIYVQEQML
jgi:hypothetical protein